MKSYLKLTAATALALILAGCGGGSNTSPVPANKVYLDFTAQGATGKVDLDGAMIDTNSGAIATGTGDVELSTGAFSYAGDTGTVDLQAGTGSINGGGSVSVFDLHPYVAGTVVQQSGATQIGFVGQSTDSTIAQAPAVATYNGASKVVIRDGNSLWTLDGTSTASIDFAAGSGSASMSNLNGTKADFGGGTSNVTDVATIGMNNLLISGNGLSGSNATITSNQLGGFLTGGANVSLQGGFFGPSAANIGGVLSVDDTTNGVLSVQGAFTGTR